MVDLENKIEKGGFEGAEGKEEMKVRRRKTGNGKKGEKEEGKLRERNKLRDREE